jgi:hypothetical protein
MMPNDPRYSSFGLIWRFADATKYTQLTPEEFSRFRPLSAEESVRRWEQYVIHIPDARTSGHLMSLLTGGIIEWPRKVAFRSESQEEEEKVRPLLQAMIPANRSDELVFFWDAETGVVTDWGLFLDHWEDFCYPSDDSNIALIPVLQKAAVYVEEKWYVKGFCEDEALFQVASGKKGAT